MANTPEELVRGGTGKWVGRREPPFGQCRRLGRTLSLVDAVRCYVENFGTKDDPGIVVYDDEGNTYAGGNDLGMLLAMDDRDKRALVETVFSAPLPGGKPAGVSITEAEGAPRTPKRFKYEFRGG